MAVFNINATESGSVENSFGSSYVTNRDTAASSATNGSGGSFNVKDNNSSGTYSIGEGLLKYDTSTASGTVSSVTLGNSLWLAGRTINDTSRNTTLYLYSYTYTSPISTGDWKTPSTFSGLTLLSSIAVPGSTGSLVFPTSSNFVSAVQSAMSGSNVLQFLITFEIPGDLGPTGVNELTFFGDGTGANREPVLSITTAGGAASYYPKVRWY